MTDLNSMLPTGSGWLLESATAINESGQIAGSGKHNGLLHAFRLTRVTAMNVTAVSAADYKGVTLAPEGIVSAFGTDLATTTQAAIATPLPLELAGTQVTLRDSSGADHAAPLFFVSPFQINFQLPSDTPTGTATVTIINGDRTISVGSIQIASVSPGIFTADSSGQGAPAGLLLRIKANQQQSYEPLARFDPAQKKYVPAPVIRQAGDQLFLVFFGTGMRNAPESDGNQTNGVAESVQASIGSLNAPVLFAGAAPGFAGLDQINLQLPAEVTTGSNYSVILKVSDGKGHLSSTNAVTIAIQ